MKYIVTKKFYDPFKKRRILVNEEINIPQKHLEGYKPYVREIGTAKKEQEEKAIVEKPKKKKKSGDK